LSEVVIENIGVPVSNREIASVTAPLPVIGVSGARRLREKWALIAKGQTFVLKYDDVKGALNHGSIYFEHATTEHFGFGLAEESCRPLCRRNLYCVDGYAGRGPGSGRNSVLAPATGQRVPRSVPFFEEAYAMAVYPSVSRFGLGFGGAGGKGYVIEGEAIIGTSRYWQFTSGIQAGVRNFSMVVLFKDKEALESFKRSDVQFMGQAGLAAGTKGIAGTPAYNDGVIVFTVTRFGLMGEFTISGAKFSYRPLPTSIN